MPDPTRRNEDEYFARESLELIARRRAELDAERAARVAAEGRRTLCPRDGGEMAEREYHGVKIDECPRCGGVFLDRGELEILEHFDDPGPARRFIAGLFGLRR
jgi:hypothetical protein